MTVRHDISQIREVEEALRRSEAKYREIFEKIQDIFFQTNDQGLIVEVSPSVERYGYTREELIGMPAARVYEDPTKRITLLQLLEDGDITDREVRLRTRDSRVVDFSISAHMLRGPDGAPAGMEGCLRDITDRKRAEEALRRSQRELAVRNKIADIFLTVPDEEMYGVALQVVLEALESRYGVFGYVDEDGALVCASMTRDVWEQCQVPDKKTVFPPEQWGGIWSRALTEKRSLYSNEPGRVPEGHIPILNSLAVPIIHRKRVIGLLNVANKEMGYDEDDRRLLETIAGHIAPILRARLQRDRQERRRRLAEGELKRHRDRLEELIDERTAELTQANKQLLREIEERKQAEEALRQSEERFRQVLEVSSDLICKVDLASGICDYVSPAVLPLTGFTQQEFAALGVRAYLRRIHPDDRPQYRQRIDDFLRQGLDVAAARRHEHRWQCKDGQYRWFSEGFALVRGEDGKPLALVVNARDTTERRQAEEALRESEKRLASIYDTVGDVIFLLDVEKDGGYRFTSVNHAFLSVTGLPAEAVVGKRVNDVIPEPSLTLVLGKYRQAVQKKAVVRWEETSDYPAGRLTGEVSVVSVFDEGGNCTHLVGTVHDITERKQAEEALRRSEQHFSKAFHASPLAIVMATVSEGRIVDVNEGFLQIMGYGREELIGRTTAELGIWVDGKERERMVREVLKRGSAPNWELKVRTRSGETRVWLGAFVTIELDGVPCLLGMSRDITEHRQAEEALRDSETRYRELFSGINSGVAVYEACSDGEDFVFRDFNQAGERIESIQKDVLLGRRVTEVFPGIREFGLLDVFRRVWRTGTPEHHPVSIYRDNRIAGWRENYVYKLPTGEIVALYEDITERKQAEEALRREMEVLQSILDNIPVMVAFLDREGHHQWVNRCWQSTLGWSAQEAPETDVLAEIYPDPEYRNYVLDFIASAVGTWGDFRMRARDGRVLDTSWANVPLSDGSNIGIGIDVTERRQAEEQARQLQAEHVRTNELRRMVRILEQMAATLGHELRNPLGVISNSVYFLANQAQLDGPKAQKHVLIIGREVASAKRVIDDILEFAHVPQLLPAAAGVNAVVDSALARSQIPANIRVHRKLAVDLPPLVCDAERLERAFIDIIANAVQAMPHGGRLGVKTCRSGDKIQVVFADSGVGIAPENLDKVFEPMFTTKLRGVGLGLTVVRRTVEQHGGSISVRSRLGRGAVFAVALPRDCRPFAAKGGRVA